jgi:hypothetical protein
MLEKEVLSLGRLGMCFECFFFFWDGCVAATLGVDRILLY